MAYIYPYLTYAGAIPFVFCAACLLSGVQEVAILGSVRQALSVYGLIIASFMAGAHWGQHLSMERPWSRALPIFSNIIAVSLWFGFLLFSFEALVVLLMIDFVFLLRIDHGLYRSGKISREYFRTRLVVSSIVVVSLAASGLT